MRASKRERESLKREDTTRTRALFVSSSFVSFCLLFLRNLLQNYSLTRLSSSLKKEEEEQEEEFVRPSQRRRRRRRRRESALGYKRLHVSLFALSLVLRGFLKVNTRFARVKIWIDQISPPSARAYFN